MGKKVKGNKFSSAEEVYKETLRLIEKWNTLGRMPNVSQISYLKSVKVEFRSKELCELVFSHPEYFNLNAEIENVPQEILTEDFLIPLVYDYPKLIYKYKPYNSNVISNEIPIGFSIAEEKLTIPVLVAFELGRRRYERISAIQWNVDREKIPYTRKTKDFRSTITTIADKVTDDIGLEKLGYRICDCQNITEKTDFTRELIDTIILVCMDVPAIKDTEYTPRYSASNPASFANLGRQLVILVSGPPDAGKTTFSNFLCSAIDNSTCFDSDQLHKANKLLYSFDSLVKAKNQCVIFSDLRANDFFKGQLFGKEVVTISIKPSDVARTYRNSKYRQGEDFSEFKGSIYNWNYDKSDYVVINDYTPEGLCREADRIIGELLEKYSERPGQSQFETVGSERIAQGVDACYLTSPVKNDVLGNECKHDLCLGN